MEPFLRRVYLSVAGLLVLLWAGMFVGVVLKVRPALFSFATAPAPLPTVQPEDLGTLMSVPGFRFSLYHSQAGDRFSGLSTKFNLLETTLRSLNQANDGSEPEPNSPLLIPSQDGIFHVVRPGQGLNDIARAYGVPFRDILKANRVRGDSDLRPGQVLYLPGATYLSQKDVAWLTLSSLQPKTAFLKPTTGRFADGFGMRIHPITHIKAFHEGLDLAPGWGARVVATQDGTVQFANFRAGYGRLIVLDHGGGLTSWYGHLDEIRVKAGQKVKKGQLIGKVGNSGRTTGPHLHFEIRLNGKPQNPLLYLTQ